MQRRVAKVASKIIMNINNTDDQNNNPSEPQDVHWSESNFTLPETHLRSSALLDEILQQVPPDEEALRQYLLLLRHQLEVDEQQFGEAQQALVEFEEAYEKLTQPANRIGVYLGLPPAGKGKKKKSTSTEDQQTALIAIGDQEYIVNIDPQLEDTKFDVGSRVKVNEAYAVVGELGPSDSGPIAKISEVLEGDRLRVSTDPQGMNSRIVYRGEALRKSTLAAGDEVRLEPNFKVALEAFPSTENRDYFLEEVPQIPWEKIGGQEEAIQIIRDTIELPLLHPEIFERFGKKPLKGILLYGPPGCGKTLIGKATAYNLTQTFNQHSGKNLKDYFMLINGPQLLNMWLGETERQIREIFTTAREKAKSGHLVFIFIDEAESILRTRSSGRTSHIQNTVVPQFSAEMDGLIALENVVVMLTSNRPDYIDPAILRPERIDRKVKVQRPDLEASKQIFDIYLHENVPLDPALLKEHKGDAEKARKALVEHAVHETFRISSDTEFIEVFTRSGGTETLHFKDLLSGALIMSMVERAKDFVIKRSIETKSDKEGIGKDDISKAINSEFRENEIFPKTDTLEDWLKLLDYEPENVVDIKPIQREGKKYNPHRNVI
jgi:proteasome-associated ATPase